MTEQKHTFLLISFLFLCLNLAPLCGQESLTVSDSPTGFRTIELGMGMDQVKSELKADEYYDYRGDPDVSLLAQPNQSLIECRGNSYIRRAFFQFNEDRLFIIILMLNQEKVDFYSVYIKLKEKYGAPSFLSPEEIIWDGNDVRFSLERPLAVKYIQKSVFAALKEQGKAQESFRDISRDRFLDQF